jgi:hypothetical protein
VFEMRWKFQKTATGPEITAPAGAAAQRTPYAAATIRARL